MRAAVMRGVGSLHLEEVADPQVGPFDVLVRVRAAGLCGSEFNKYRGDRNTVFPFIPGHEWSGDVVDVGSAVTRTRIGDRVVGEACIHCGLCEDCATGLGPPYCEHVERYGLSGDGRQGALAEYIAVSERAAHPLPDHVSYEAGALVEPTSVGYYAIWGVGGGVAPHDRVAVFGAGPVGLLALLVVKAASAPAIVLEPSPYRRQLAEQLGADAVINPLDEDVVRGVLAHTGGRGATLVLECSANAQAVAATPHVIATGGRIVLVGMKDGPDVPLSMIEAQFRKAQILGSQGAPFFFPHTLAFVTRAAADLTQVITHRFPLEAIESAFEFGAHTADSGKILIDPWSTG